VVHNRLFSNQVEMIAGHADRTPRGLRCSRPQATEFVIL
jgi:hypothetical protein